MAAVRHRIQSPLKSWKLRMKGKSYIHCKVVLVLTLCFSASSMSSASTVSFELQNFTGRYEYPSILQPSSKSESFDIGVQFSSITNVELVITASGNHGLSSSCGLGTCYYGESGREMFYSVFQEPEYVYGSSSQGKISITEESTIFHENIDGPYDKLLDGRAEIYIGIEVILLPALEISHLSTAVLNIDNIRLDIKGTVIPLPPVTFLFLLTGSILLLFRRKSA